MVISDAIVGVLPSVAHLGNTHPIANSPWAMPVCGDCFDDFVESFNKQSGAT